MPTTTTRTLSVSRLNDQQLLANIRELARQERWLNTQIIDHLREIEARGLHLRAGFSVPFDYAVKELGFGEGSAYHRAHGAEVAPDPRGVRRSASKRFRQGQGEVRSRHRPQETPGALPSCQRSSR